MFPMALPPPPPPPPQPDRSPKSFGELLGEFHREAAVLVFVFGHLEQILRNQGLDFGLTAGVWAFSVGFFVAGWKLERAFGGNHG
jgi:hypothetical protein